MNTNIVLTPGKISHQGGQSEKEEEILQMSQLYGLTRGQVITPLLQDMRKEITIDE